MGVKMDIHIPHGHDLTRIIEAAFDLDIGQRAIPGQVNLALEKASTGHRNPHTRPNRERCRAFESAFQSAKRHSFMSEMRHHRASPYLPSVS